MKKYMFRISVIVLIFVLAIVSFYMLYVHVPYYNYHYNLDNIRNEICEKNNYEYNDYFFEYRGKQTYYIMKVKINKKDAFVAYDQDMKFVDIFKDKPASKQTVKKAMETKYKKTVDEVDVGYENNKFVYYTMVQEEEKLTYIYYDFKTGDFTKAYML